MDSVNTILIEFEEKQYFLIDKIKVDDITFAYFCNTEDNSDIKVFSLSIEDGEESYILVEDEAKMDIASDEFLKKHDKNTTN